MKADETASQSQGSSTKTWLLIAVILLLAVAVPVGLYFISKIPFSNGSSGSNLSVPDTGITVGPAPAPAAPQPAGRRMMDMLVVDQQTKQPVSDMEVQSNFRNGGAVYTDASGHARVALSGNNSNYFEIRVSGHKYLPMRLSWNRFDSRLGGDDIPTSFTMMMERGTTIGGKIVDDAGQPIAGATVFVYFNKRYPNRHERVDVVGSGRGGQPIHTGNDGSWTFADAPPDCDQVTLGAWDYGYVLPDPQVGQMYADVPKLYDKTATLVLRRGVALDGTVTGPDGEPVVGATVALGNMRNGRFGNFPVPKTDASGKFIYHLDPGQHTTLTIQAPHYAPEMKQIAMGGSEQSISISLTKAHRIFGRVVDSNGKPVPDAEFDFQNWRGMQTLNVDFRSDPSGYFHWNEAPADPVTFNVQAPNLRGTGIDLSPDKENVVNLGAVNIVRGSVVNAATGKPIDNFQITLGIVFNANDEQVNWQPGWNQDFGKRAGGFQFPYIWSFPGIALRIEAKGYLPAESRIVRAGQGNVMLSMKLEPGKDITATVHAADGSVVSGALGVMALSDQQAYVENSRDVMNMGTPQATSGADGVLDFAPQKGDFKIAVFADAGYAEADRADLEKSPDMKLQPYGRIEGRMMVGANPAADTGVDLQRMAQFTGNGDRIIIQDQLSGRTDTDGKFVIDRVPPGTWSVCRRVPISSNGWTEARLVDVEVAPGKTALVNVGGKGRPVVGKVVVPSSILNSPGWSFGFCQITSRNDAAFARPPMPALVQMLPQAAQQQWMENWLKTDAGKTFLANQQKAMAQRVNIPFSISADGSFRIDDVLAGSYQVAVNIRPDQPQPGTMGLLAVGGAELTIPEMPGGRSDQPFQIDPIQMIPLQKLAVGDQLPDMPMRSTDGKDLKFADFQGKYLLLDFVNRENLGTLKDAYTEYSNDSRLAFLSVNRGMFVGVLPPRNPGIPWQQAWVVAGGPNASMILFNDFDLQNSRGEWLIGPDGKVLAKDLSGDAIEMAIITAIGPPATQPAKSP